MRGAGLALFNVMSTQDKRHIGTENSVLYVIKRGEVVGDVGGSIMRMAVDNSYRASPGAGPTGSSHPSTAPPADPAEASSR